MHLAQLDLSSLLTATRRAPKTHGPRANVDGEMILVAAAIVLAAADGFAPPRARAAAADVSLRGIRDFVEKSLTEKAEDKRQAAELDAVMFA